MLGLSVKILCKAATYILLFVFSFSLEARTRYKPKLEASIDVVIPAIKKDLSTLNLCIEGIRKNCKQVGRIIVVSPEKLTNKAEWFSENAYPFTKFQVALELCKGNEQAAREYMKNFPASLGWYYQQLLKLYAPFVLPEIAPNVLVLDADTIFLNKVSFISDTGEVFYNVGQAFHLPYFEHAAQLIPGFRRVFAQHSGICHHMLFQKTVLLDLFDSVEKTHGVEFWKAFCRLVDDDELCKSGASEYEIYFNFVFSKVPTFAKIRELKWRNSLHKNKIRRYRAEGYHYVSFHTYIVPPGTEYQYRDGKPLPGKRVRVEEIQPPS